MTCLIHLRANPSVSASSRQKSTTQTEKSREVWGDEDRCGSTGLKKLKNCAPASPDRGTNKAEADGVRLDHRAGNSHVQDCQQRGAMHPKKKKTTKKYQKQKRLKLETTLV